MDPLLTELSRYLGPLTPVNADDISRLADHAAAIMAAIRDQSVAPDKKKVLRPFSLTEVADLLKLNTRTVQRRVRDGSFPAGTQPVKRHARYFTLADVHAMMRTLGQVPRRDEKRDDCLIITVANFKGGSGKTSTASHLAQYLALMGYRTLIIDGDPQSTQSAVLGMRVEAEVSDEMTLLPLLNGDQKTVEYAVRPTYWDGLDVIPANLSLFAAEFTLPNRQARESTFQFYDVLRRGLADCRKKWDVVVIDTPPSLSYVASNAVQCADGLLVPVPPAQFDLDSSAAFMRMVGETTRAFNKHSASSKTWCWLRFVVTKHDNSAFQNALGNRIRKTYGEFVLSNMMPSSVAIQRAGGEMRTLYELESYEGGRSTYRRAVLALNLVNREIERLIRSQWPSQRAALLSELQLEAQHALERTGT